jgi:hypothetical protein
MIGVQGPRGLAYGSGKFLSRSFSASWRHHGNRPIRYVFKCLFREISSKSVNEEDPVLSRGRPVSKDRVDALLDRILESITTLRAVRFDLP